MTQWYRIGTCSVASGTKTVTFSTGVTLNLSVKPGDALLIGTGTNQPVEIGSITDNTHCELVENWPYASATSAVYAVIPGPNWDDRTALSLDVATYLAAVSGVTQSSTTLTIGTGSQTLQIPHSTRLSPGAFVTISDTAAPTTRYMAGIVTSYIGSTLTVSVTAIAGSGSGSSWNVNVGGSPGATGSTGPTGPLGATGPAAWSAVAAWAASTAYVVGPPASVVTYLGETYVCTTAHTSTGSFDASKFSKVAAKGADAAGLTDGDKGDIIVSSSGTVFTLDNAVRSPGANLLINGDFQVNQRGFAGGSLAFGSYGFDRWKASTGGASISLSNYALTLTSGTIEQSIETAYMAGVASLASTDLTVSFEIMSGSSGSLTVTAGSTTSTSITTTTAGRTSVTLTTGAGDAGNLTVKIARVSGTPVIARVKVEAGSNATPWQARPSTVEVALCHRYYYTSGTTEIYLPPINLGSGFRRWTGMLAIPMRVPPTITATILSNGTISYSAHVCTEKTLTLIGDVSDSPSTAIYSYCTTFTLNAEL